MADDSTTNNIPVNNKETTWFKQHPEGSPAPTLSVIIPAYNEQSRISQTLIEMIDYLDLQQKSYEIIVVNDGSKDHTADIVRRFARIRPQVRLINQPENYGKGYAVKTGMLSASGALLLFADADGATPFIEIERLLNALSRTKSEVAIGSRAIVTSDTKIKAHPHRKIIGRIFNSLVNFILLPKYKDTQCGFKLFTQNAAQVLFPLQRAKRFSFDVEILYLASKYNLQVTEVAINWTNVPGSKVNLILDSADMFFDLIKIRFWHK